MGRAHAQSNGSGISLALIGFIFTIIINIGTMSYTAGVLTTRVTSSEETIKELKNKVENFGALSTKMASVEANLEAIKETLQRLERQFGNNKGKN